MYPVYSVSSQSHNFNVVLCFLRRVFGWRDSTHTQTHICTFSVPQLGRTRSTPPFWQCHRWCPMCLRCPMLPCVLPGTKVTCPVSWAGCARTRQWINLAWDSSNGKNPWLTCQENCKCTSADSVNVRGAESCPVNQKMNLCLFCQLLEIGMSILSLINF